MNGTIVKEILDWSEVWALLIPIMFFFIRKKNRDDLFPIGIYLFVALIFNLVIALVSNSITFRTDYLSSNHIFYNLHSVAKVFFFGSLITRSLPKSLIKISKLLLTFYALFILIKFSFFDSILPISSLILTIESIILLFFSISWFLYVLQQDEKRSPKTQVLFLVICGLSLYEAINFFIFLFFTTLLIEAGDFSIHIWNVHNISFIVLCLFIARAYYESGK